MTALPSKKQKETKVKIALDITCLIMRLVTESPPHSIQRGVWPRVRRLRTRVQRKQESRKLLIRLHLNHVNTTFVPGNKTRSLRVAVDTSTRKSRLNRKKACRYTFQNYATYVALLRVNPVEVRHQQTQQEVESLRPRCSSCHGFGHLLPATTVISLWSSVLKNEGEWEEVHDPSHAERPLAPFLRPRCLRQSCGQLPRLLDPTYPFGGAFSHTSTGCDSSASTSAVPPAAVVVVATLTFFATTPTVAVPVAALVAAWRFFPGFRYANDYFGARPKGRVGVFVVGY